MLEIFIVSCISVALLCLDVLRILTENLNWKEFFFPLLGLELSFASTVIVDVAESTFNYKC